MSTNLILFFMFQIVPILLNVTSQFYPIFYVFLSIFSCFFTRSKRRRAKDLLYMLQEEKVARDVYKKMAEKYNVRIFQNISISEQRHMDAVRSKIDKYSIPYKTITEMIYVSDEIRDGLYLMDLNVTNFSADASPSRPLLYKLK